MSNPHSPVVVNFNINVDAQTGVVVFEDAPATLDNVVVCKTELPVDHLYVGDLANEALFEFQGNDNEISGRALVGDEKFGTTARGVALGAALDAILTNDATGADDELDATLAAPFDESAYGLVSQFRKYKSFGRLALAAYAHYIFGHVQATAAISNDTSIINYMNGSGSTDAKIANSLVLAIYGMTTSKATDVVKQVIGQDASRAKDVDNDLTSPESWQRLKWVQGDKIYVQVTLLRPNTVKTSVGNSDADAGVEDVQQYNAASAALSMPLAGIQYNLEITIGAPTEV